MCYKHNNEYAMGKYEKQSGYVLYNSKCPACYKDSNGNYIWTSDSNNGKIIDSSINLEEVDSQFLLVMTLIV